MSEPSPEALPLHGVLGQVAIETAGPIAPAVEVRTLADLAVEYALFNHGCLFTRLGLDEWTQDPVSEYLMFQAEAAMDVARIDLAWPVFRGIAQAPYQEVWDRRLLACDRAHWPGLWKWLTGVAVVDRAAQSFHRLAVQPLRVLDPLALGLRPAAAAAPLPTLPITVFGVAGTRLNLRFRQRTALPRDRAEAVEVPPDRRLLWDAHQLFAGHADPFLSTPHGGRRA